MPKQKQHKIKTNSKLALMTLTVFLPIFILIESILLFTTFSTGLATFPLKVIECGQQPYIKSNFVGSPSYTAPGDGLYYGPDMFTDTSDMYCTRAQVEKTGASESVYSELCQETPKAAKCRSLPGGDGFGPSIRFHLIVVALASVLSLLISLGIIKNSSKKRS